MNILDVDIRIFTAFSLFISILALFVTIWNVPRQRKANLKNDEERFRRDLNLKTAEGFIEKLYAAKNALQKTRSLETTLNFITRGMSKTENLTEALWAITEDKNMDDFIAYFESRQIILDAYATTVNELQQGWRNVDQALWNFKNFWVPGKTDLELMIELKKINMTAEPLIEKCRLLQVKIKNDFLGKIYDKTI